MIDSSAYMGWKRWEAGEFGLVPPGRRFYFDQVFKDPKDGKGRILEIGFGNGALLGYFRCQGHEVIGVEINDCLVKRACDSGYVAYRGAVWDIPQLEQESFDIIVAFDVLEHMADVELNKLCLWAKNHLRDCGKLYLRFPEGASPFGLANQNGDFTHVSCLTMPKIEVLGYQSDLKLVSYFDDFLSSNSLCAFGFAGRAVLLGIQAYAGALRLFLKAMFYPLAPAVRFSANSIAVLARADGIERDQI